jgi:hypothetical protein
MIRVEAATFDAVAYVAANLREQDRVELSATSSPDGLYLPERVMGYASAAFVSRDENAEPISVWGLCPMWPGVGTAFAFGTDQWPRALLTMTRHVKRFMLPLVLENGYHRIECRALAHREDVGRWVAQFGAVAEAVLRSSGRRGEDFTLYRWLSDEHRRRANPDQTGNLVAAGERRRHSGIGSTVPSFL